MTGRGNAGEVSGENRGRGNAGAGIVGDCIALGCSEGTLVVLAKSSEDETLVLVLGNKEISVTGTKDLAPTGLKPRGSSSFCSGVRLMSSSPGDCGLSSDSFVPSFSSLEKIVLGLSTSSLSSSDESLRMSPIFLGVDRSSGAWSRDLTTLAGSVSDLFRLTSKPELVSEDESVVPDSTATLVSCSCISGFMSATSFCSDCS